MKRIFPALFSVLLLMSAHAEHAVEYTGTTAFLKSEIVYAEIGGRLEAFTPAAGESVRAGERLGMVETVKVYAEADGTVRGISAEEGERADGEIFVIEPKEKYKLLASAGYAYDKPENALVHPGETVYASCVTDGSHRAIGYVADVNGEEFTVYTTHGNLYLGEAVVLYREEALHYKSRIARATVYANDPASVCAEGTIVKMYAAEGDRVEKGELLFEYIQDGGKKTMSREIVSDADGVITQVYAASSDTVSVGDALYAICKSDWYGVTVQVSQETAARISKGTEAYALFACDDTETGYALEVLAVSPYAENADGQSVYTVMLTFAELPERLFEGLHVYVTF